MAPEFRCRIPKAGRGACWFRCLIVKAAGFTVQPGPDRLDRCMDGIRKDLQQLLQHPHGFRPFFNFLIEPERILRHRVFLHSLDQCQSFFPLTLSKRRKTRNQNGQIGVLTVKICNRNAEDRS